MQVYDIILKGSVGFFGKGELTIITTEGVVVFKGEYTRSELMENLPYEDLFAKVAYLDREDDGLIIGIFE